jgi:CBS domain-containing protein
MENVLLFLTPKSTVAYLQEDFTLRQAIEKMKFHRYSSVPIIDENGKYVGTITEGDIFWFIYNSNELATPYDLEDVQLKSVPRARDNKPVTASAHISDLFDKAIKQNFVPVVDDSNSFIGIITRKTVIEHLINSKK